MNHTLRNHSTRALLLLLGVLSPMFNVMAGGLVFPRDGWVSWEIETIAAAPAWCCFDWRSRNTSKAECQLDGPSQGYGSSDDDEGVSKMRVYAHFTLSKLDRLRALAISCPVVTKNAVQPLDAVTAEASLRWLTTVVTPHSKLSDDALAALAVHKGDTANDALGQIARSDASTENRKQALFWATQLRGADGLRMTLPFLFDDKDARVREHAAFAVAQTKSPQAVAALIKQGREDASTQVRAQAWFWLAQTGAADAEAAIRSALATESSRHVREQAVFALSQLPEPQNIAALVRIAEDRSLARGDRKQALFWLGQSQSAEAMKYLDKLLL